MNTASEFMLSDMNALMVSTDANEQDLRDRLIKYKNEKMKKKRGIERGTQRGTQ